MIFFYVLLVTSNSEDYTQVYRFLNEAPTSATRDLGFQVDCCHHLEEAIAQLSEKHFDVLLISLNSPDSQAMDTLQNCQEQFPHLAIVVFTENRDETLRVQCLQLGAQGYLVKDQIDSKLLVYSLRLAIEQKRQLQVLQQNQLKRLQEQEIMGLRHIADTVKTQITAKLFGLSLLRESSPEIFQEIVQQYGELMDLSMEQRVYKVDYNISEQLRNMGEQLGFLKASPRDVVEIHTQVLKAKTQNSNPVKAQAYVSEGRLMVLELMGYLASYYRKYFIGLSKLNVTKNYKNLKP
ncbi:response regulator [Roseofilum capinflatum]|uniref:Response regulator n=1 Tax=Roseofilum capinflatum BLCC-M114 TaxID=3022440 RepID=A0ABT7B865_9CYAN|nr:response regulator [Roseofilum capinflatum]MDJ1174473.1 response regulator [Roseofilum capinflatum BLCC-M114]